MHAEPSVFDSVFLHAMSCQPILAYIRSSRPAESSPQPHPPLISRTIHALHFYSILQQGWGEFKTKESDKLKQVKYQAYSEHAKEREEFKLLTMQSAASLSLSHSLQKGQ